MSSLICLFFLVWIGWTQGELNNQLIINTWYQTWINNAVVSPFLTVYTTLNKKIIEKIMLINPNSDEKTIKSLINLLKCRFETVHKQLRQLTDATAHIRISLAYDEKMMLRGLTSQENLVRLKEKDVNETENSLELAEHTMKLAESTMNDYQRSVNAAERDLQIAQKAVDRSNKCSRRRRKKRFLGLCGLFNWSGSKNAHERLSLAMQNKHSAQQRLKFQQQILTNQTFRYKTTESQLNDLTAQLHTLQFNLHQREISLRYMDSLAKRFLDIETYLQDVLNSSTIFKDQLKNLIDFENVIEPLNNIYEEMINSKLINVNNINISTETIHLTSKNLEKVKEIIKTWDKIETDENDLNVSCLLIENN